MNRVKLKKVMVDESTDIKNKISMAKDYLMEAESSDVPEVLKKKLEKIILWLESLETIIEYKE